MLRIFRFVVALYVFAVASAAGSVALAAPVPWQSVNVILQAEQSGNLLLVSGELPSNTKLPAEGVLTVPAGSEIQWIGEILGGDASADPELEFVKATVGGMDEYRFTMAKSRIAQVEVLALVPQAFDGTNYTASLMWQAAQPVPEVRMSIRVPQGSALVGSSSETALEPAGPGYSYYTRTVQNVKAGDQTELAVTYSAPSAAAGAGNSSSDAGPTAIIVVVLAFLIMAGIAAFVVRSSAKTPTAELPEEVVAEVMEAQPLEEPTSDAAPGPPAVRDKRVLIAAVALGLALVSGVVIGTASTKPKQAGDIITQTFSQGQPCATSNIGLTVPAGANPGETAEALFAALRSVPSLNSATYNARTSSIEVGYCEDQADEAAVRAALQPTGFVAQ